MELVLNGLQWQICLIYFSENFDDHLQRLDLVLDRITQAGLKLKPEKCQFFRDEVAFLGHLVSERGIQPNPDNVAKILGWPTSKTVTEVRQLLGMGSYYRRFIKDFSSIVKPLTELTKKDREFKWTDACQQSFEKLKLSFTGTEIMGFPKDEGTFTLDTDASDTTIGAVLSQEQEGQIRVIAYGSRTMNKAERNYCITDKELLAVRYFTEHYRQYLLGRRFIIRTDHQALKWLFSLKEPKGRVARWLEILSSFNFEVEYRPGARHGNADTMSRFCNPRDRDCSDQDNLEYLKCGPCNKCHKRAIDMDSSFISQKEHGIDQRDPNDIEGKGVPHKERVCAVKTRQQVLEETSSSSWTAWNGGYSAKELKELQQTDQDLGPLVK